MSRRLAGKGLLLVLGLALAACRGGAGERLGQAVLAAPRPDPLAATLPPGGESRLARARPNRTEADMREAPELFTGAGEVVWDGSPTLEGLWVAHPGTPVAQQVRMRNPRTGTVIDGALLPRPGESGSGMAISAEAADALGLLPGVPASVELVAILPEEARPRRVAARVPYLPDRTAPAAAPDGQARAATGAAIDGNAEAAPRQEGPATPARRAAGSEPSLPNRAGTEPEIAAAGPEPISQAAAAARPSSADAMAAAVEAPDERSAPAGTAAPEPAGSPPPPGGSGDAAAAAGAGAAPPEGGGAPPPTPAASGIAEGEGAVPASAGDPPNSEASATAPVPGTGESGGTADSAAPNLVRADGTRVTGTEGAAPPERAAAEESPDPAAGTAAAGGPGRGIGTPITDGRTYIQAGYFAVPAHAADLVRTLSAQGIPATNREETVRGTAYNRVIAGPFDSREARERALDRLRAIGITDARPFAG